MRVLFVDTGAFVAKEIAGDQFHAVARTGWSQLERQGVRLVSSEHVFDESATLIARRSQYAFASMWGSDALDSGIEWLRCEEADWNKALGLMRKFADQGVSFTDCVSAVLMKRNGLKTVFGFDQHFESMGFRVWPDSSMARELGK
jgi:predicted nucleic acid-binding protein